jgi:hypothetical protein
LGNGEPEDYINVSRDDERHINIANCQYYIEIDKPDRGYHKSGDYYVPLNWAVEIKGATGIDNKIDTTISSWYRGYRYGYAQQSKYIPLLERYCGLYEHNGEEVYGFSNNEYNSPTIMKNMVTNTEFKGTTGWTATYFGPEGNLLSTYAPKVEVVYGKFRNGEFSSVIDDL